MANQSLLLALLLACASATFGQTFIMTGAPIISCTGTFYDGGGSTGNYPNNQNLHTTICPDASGGTHILLQFDSAVLVPGDVLCFLDGATVFAPPLACASDFPSSQPFAIQASAGNNSGCLTLTFLSDATGNAAGWSAAISCAAPCVIPAPANVQVVRMNGGEMVWTWNAVPGSAGFAVSVNGGAWQPASGALSHTVSGLSPGALVVIEIRPISANPGCSVQSITANRTYVECTLSVSVVSTNPALCPGAATGSAVVSASGATGAVQFFIAGNPTPFPNGNFQQIFAAGNYLVAAHDAAGCRDTVAFVISEPPPIAIQITATDAECFADNSGAVQASATGGTPPLTYAWRRCQGGMVMPGPTAIDLFAGCYAVTVTDANGCTAVAQDTVGEPPKFDFSATQDSVRCFGGMDGRASVFASGAIPPYTYLWGNGDTTPTADSLKAGFHTVTVTDAVGCQAVTLVQVLQPSLLLLNVVSTTAVTCFGGTDGTATVAANGGSAPYTFAWSGGQSGATPTNLPAGTHTVTVTDGKGCTATNLVSVPTPAALVAQLTNIQNETCAGLCNGSLTLSITGGTPTYAVAWSNPAVPPGTTAPQNLCPGPYTATVTDNNGCTNTASATIAAAVPLGVQLNAVPPACAGDQNGAITASGNGGTPPYTYLWSNGGTGSALSNLACGTYTVTVSDAVGCSVVGSTPLPCPTLLQLDSINALPVRCFGEANGTATVFATGGTGTLSYLWNDPNQQISPAASNLPAGTYTVTVTDGNGCSRTATATVPQPQPVTGTLSATPVSCFGGNDGTATAVATGGTPPYTYAWNVPQTGPTIANLPAGTYTATVTDALGCMASTAPITVGQPGGPVQVGTIQTQSACFGGANGAALATATGGNGTPFAFQWSNGATVPNPDNFSAGTYTVTASDAKGCTGTQNITIVQWDSLDVSIGVISPTCSNTTDGQASIIILKGGAGNGVRSNYTLQWNVPGVGDTLYLSGLAGGQQVIVTVTDHVGCSKVYERTIPGTPPIVPLLQTDSIACHGQTNGALRIISVQSARPIVQYRWSTGATETSITGIPAGTYTVTATDTQGCTGTASATLTEPPPLLLNLLVDDLVCNNDSNGRIQAIVQGGMPTYNYNWNTGSVAASIANLGPGTYTATVTDQNGCTTERSATLSQPDPPQITVETTAPTCFGYRNGQARLLVSNGTPPYRFSLDGQVFSGSSVFLGLPAGAYLGYVQDGRGCITTVAVTLNQPPPIEVLTDPDLTITLGDSVLLSADAFNTAGAAIYRWQSALVDNLRCADPPECSGIWVSPGYSNTYTVVVTDANNCTGTASVRVTVEKPRGVYVPTAFSPNGDGNNDLLVVHGKGSQIRRIVVFRVFDRWGELVYEDADFPANDLQRGWNGQLRGQDCQSGIYTWYVQVEYLDGFEQVAQGNTALIR